MSEKEKQELEEKKSVVKEALKEWLDEKFLQFGKWSFGALMAFILAGIVYIILKAEGFKVTFW